MFLIFLTYVCCIAAVSLSPFIFFSSLFLHFFLIKSRLHVFLESRFFIRFFSVVLCWTLKIYCINILNIFLIYFKTSKLVVISVLWRHSKEITQKISKESKFVFLPLFHKDSHGIFNKRDEIVKIDDNF